VCHRAENGEIDNVQVVVKIGGSLLYRQDGHADLERIRSIADSIRAIVDEGHSLIVIVGGGRPAREFISTARSLGASETQCDWIGIKIARLNAELLCAALGEYAYPKIVESLDELETAVESGKVILMGGLTPAQSTNAVAALAAEVIGADMLLNATNVDGVYDRDPKEPGATLLDTVTVSELERILSAGSVRAGEYRLFDPVAIRVVNRSRIRTVIFNGTDSQNILRLVRGERIGTHIIPEES